MRKIFAILMLCLYLFNLAGYRLFFNYCISKSNQQITCLADNNRFIDSQLTEIKIKLNLPYITDWADYERYDGSMSINGVHYNYIKRKIARDTLYLLCLTNEVTTQLTKKKIDYAAKVNDAPSENNNNSSTAKKYIFTSEFKQGVLSYNFSAPGIAMPDIFKNMPAAIADSYHPDNAGEPPEIKC